MKQAAVIVFASVVGIHCGIAEPDSVVDERELSGGTSDGAGPEEGRATPAAPDEPGEEVPSFVLFSGNRGSRVTTRARGDHGASYVAGVFSGAISAGGSVLQSRGEEDVFLARLDSDGSVAWVRAVGSRRAESRPRVTFEDGQVKLLAMTGGAVDCGQGELNTWSSDMFFLCVFGDDGELINGGTFPTGSP